MPEKLNFTLTEPSPEGSSIRVIMYTATGRRTPTCRSISRLGTPQVPSREQIKDPPNQRGRQEEFLLLLGHLWPPFCPIWGYSGARSVTELSLAP